MDARFARTVTGSLALVGFLYGFTDPCWGAGFRTQNFIVTAATQQMAQEIGVAAEQYRRDLAMSWLGQPLPNWPQPCPISVQAGPHRGAGGATSFMFEGRQPFGWRMTIEGSRERLLDSVLPHEITHTIFATHFGRPLPRWADEGACTTVEHASEIAKQEKFLLQFLKSRPPRSIPFNRMVRMTEYPRDILPLYAQGHSVARFLINQGGRRKFVDFVGRGMDSQQWDAAVLEFYGYQDLSELQLDWIEWVGQGSPNADVVQLASLGLGPKQQPGQSRFGRGVALAANGFVPPRPQHPLAQSRGSGPRSSAGGPSPSGASLVTAAREPDSWYARDKQSPAVAAPQQSPSHVSAAGLASVVPTAPLPWRAPPGVANAPVELRRRAGTEPPPVYMDAPLTLRR